MSTDLWPLRVKAAESIKLQSELDLNKFQQPAPTDFVLAMAAGYMTGYPCFLERIGWLDKPQRARDNPQTRLAYETIFRAHEAAAQVLMDLAEKIGVPSGPIWEYARVCRELFASQSPGSYFGDLGGASSDVWPECLGNARIGLPQDYRDAIRQGETTLQVLNSKLKILPPSLTRPLTHEELREAVGLDPRTVIKHIADAVQPVGRQIVIDLTKAGIYRRQIEEYLSSHPVRNKPKAT